MKLKYIFKNIGWSSLFLIFLLVGIFIYSHFKQSALNNKANFVKGISLGVNSGVRGHLYLNYTFDVRGRTYKGSLPASFCKVCHSCCDIGDTIIVRYESENPKNNDLVLQLPDRASLEVN